MNLASLIEKAKSENVELDIKSACFAMGFVAGQEARKRETNRPICVTVTFFSYTQIHFHHTSNVFIFSGRNWIPGILDCENVV